MQGIHKIGSIVTSVILLSSLTWNALYGQPVPVFPPEAGTVPIYRIIDSLEIHKLEIDIQKADEQATQTNIFHRLIPNISISASYGIGNLLFIDPSSYTTYVVAKRCISAFFQPFNKRIILFFKAFRRNTTIIKTSNGVSAYEISTGSYSDSPSIRIAGHR